jgi:hypothetical protein
VDRRGFLGSILAACAAPAIVRADSLMRIVPTDTLVAFGTHTIEAEYDEFVVTSCVGNRLLTIDMIVAEALRIAHDKAAFIGQVNREYSLDELRVGDRITIAREPGRKRGDTLRVRLPDRYVPMWADE